MVDIFEKAKEYKNFLELNNICVSFEKNGNKITLNRYFYTDFTLISISAIAWKRNNWQDYVKLTSKIKIPKQNSIDIFYIRYYLICEIFKKAIKKLF